MQTLQNPAFPNLEVRIVSIPSRPVLRSNEFNYQDGIEFVCSRR